MIYSVLIKYSVFAVIKRLCFIYLMKKCILYVKIRMYYAEKGDAVDYATKEEDNSDSS